MPAPIGPLDGPALHIDLGRQLTRAQRDMLKGRTTGTVSRVHAWTESALRRLGLLDSEGAPTTLGRAVAGYF